MFVHLALPRGGDFWTRPSLIDSTDEEVVVLLGGTAADPHRAEAVADALCLAARTMIVKEVKGRC